MIANSNNIVGTEMVSADWPAACSFVAAASKVTQLRHGVLSSDRFGDRIPCQQEDPRFIWASSFGTRTDSVVSWRRNEDDGCSNGWHFSDRHSLTVCRVGVTVGIRFDGS